MDKSLNLFSKNVDYYLTKKDITRSEFARKVDMSPSHISRYLNGNTEPGIGVVTRFAEALGLEPWELLKPPGATEARPDSGTFQRLVALLLQADEQALKSLESVVSQLVSQKASKPQKIG